MRLKSTLATVFTVVAMSTVAQTPVYLDDTKPVEERVNDALSRMTTAEKIAVIHAQSKFSSPGVPRLGIPGIWCTDGPHGIRPDVLWDEWTQAGATNDSCVAFPALTCLAATWNPDMAVLYGKSIGEEARYRNKNVLLGPGVNINRTPLNGRNFEYMGEDPLLAATMVVPYVRGVQDNGVAACVKHYAVNNQEVDRTRVDVQVDDRTLYEIYLPAFKAAIVEGRAWAIMPAYNKYHGDHACENQRLLLDILKGDWAFDGVTISDWGAAHNTEKVAANGLDMEFGTWTDGLSFGATNAYDNYYLAKPYEKLILEGKADTAMLNDKARRVLRLIMRTEMNRNRPYGSLNSPEHYAAARQIGGEGIVLLKNENNLLPVSPDVKKILVVGENAVKMMTVGGGSSSLKAQHEILPLDGIRANALSKGIEVAFERGYVGDVRGECNGVTTGQNLADTRTPEQLAADAVKAAGEADMVIFIGGLNKSGHQDNEGTDRKSFDLPYGQNELIQALVKANPRTVVVTITGNAYAMPWLDGVPAVVQGWYIGSEAGNAIADVLFGDVNPSGKLPFTMAVALEDYAPHADGDATVYPGVDHKVIYKEGLGIGYRHTDKLPAKRVNFAFGHGQSYTTFALGKPQLSNNTLKGDDVLTVTVPVTNTGKREGAEVVQLYVHELKSKIDRPQKELKAFDKVSVEPGKTVDATMTVDRRAFAFYNPDTALWTVNPGRYELLIGNASDAISNRVTVNVPDTITWRDSEK